MIVEKNTFEAPAAPEAAAPTPEAAAPTPEAVADTKASSVANYHRISNKIINEIFNMLKTNNKALIISETKYSDNNKDEKKNINGVYTLNKDNETPLQYIYKSATSPNTIIYLTYRLNSIEPKYYISLTIKSDGNIVGYNLEFSLEHFTTLLLKDNKPYSFSDGGNISFTINFQDNPSTETEDSLLDIVEGNLSNVFDTLDIKESKITINNPNTKTDDYLLDIVEGNLSNVFDTLNDNTDDDALKLIKFLINYHDINSNVSALNLIQFLINYHDINSNVSALNLIKFLINSRDINIKDNPNTKTDDSLLDIVEENLNNVFDTLNIKELKFTNSLENLTQRINAFKNKDFKKLEIVKTDNIVFTTTDGINNDINISGIYTYDSTFNNFLNKGKDLYIFKNNLSKDENDLYKMTYNKYIYYPTLFLSYKSHILAYLFAVNDDIFNKKNVWYGVINPIPMSGHPIPSELSELSELSDMTLNPIE